MATFSDRLLRLDQRVFDKLSDGQLLVDGVPIPATYDQASFLFGETRGNERVLSVSVSLASQRGIRVTKASQLQWNGKKETLAEPPIFENGLIKLVLV